MRRWLTWILLLCLLPGIPALAEQAAETGAWPALNAEGFLDEGEFVWEDPDRGLWRYASPTLKIEIVQRSHEEPKPLIWWEADIWTRGEERWFMPTAVEGKHLSVSHWPYLVAQEHKVVFAINNDYAQGRIANKNNKVGIILRDGKLLWSKTRSTKNDKAFPCLDLMAFMPDGSFAVFDSNEHSAQEYVDMGIQNMLCFGPWLIRDGVLNEAALNANRQKTYRNPRTVIGMVENGHYVAIVCEGRTKRSKGEGLAFMAQLLLDKGCTVGFNLDGGETSFMMFMGVQLNVAGGANNKYGSARRASDIVAIGTSERVTAQEPAVIRK